MKIEYLKHNEINIPRWNYCVENSLNTMVYSMSWYLDIVCENWDAIVVDNYKAVIPLPWKRKFGIKYIYHPFFSQQLGLFFTDASHNNITEFIKYIPNTFVKYELSCNYMNNVKQLSTPRINYILNLDNSYQDLQKYFSGNTKRNIKKGEKNSLEIKDNISAEDFLILKKQNNISGIDNNNFEVLHKLFSTLVKGNYAKIIGAYNIDKVLVGAAIFVEFNDRIVYLFSASSNIGKKQRVMFAIVNSVIKNYAGQNKVIDFEGSMIDGVARFFKGFGAKVEAYHRINKSRIPYVK